MVEQLAFNLEGLGSSPNTLNLFLLHTMRVKDSLMSVGYNHLLDYPTPSNLNFFWGIGAYAAAALGIQMLTGISLAMHYTPNVNLVKYFNAYPIY